MPSRDVNAATRLAEASRRRDKVSMFLHIHFRLHVCCDTVCESINVSSSYTIKEILIH